MGQTAVITRVERQLADKLRAVAKLNDRSVSAELRMAIREYLAGHGTARRECDQRGETK